MYATGCNAATEPCTVFWSEEQLSCAIVWAAANRFQGDCELIRVSEASGSASSYLSKSWFYSYKSTQSYVGKVYNNREALFLPDAQAVSPEVFHRVKAAKKSGVQSIIFIPKDDGSVLELCFKCVLKSVPGVPTDLQLEKLKAVETPGKGEVMQLA